MKKQFVLFRRGRRLCAALVPLPEASAGLTLDGKHFALVGRFIHLTHIVDAKQHLVGFNVDGLEGVTTDPNWKEWWSTFDNRELEDFWQVYLFLSDQRPSDWFPDGALLVGGGAAFGDGTGDYALVLPDENGRAADQGQPDKFWKQIAFKLEETNSIKSD